MVSLTVPVGNGWDTVALAKLVMTPDGGDVNGHALGQVVAFDIQQAAVESTRGKVLEALTAAQAARVRLVLGRGLHSFIIQLNLSTFHWRGDAFSGCLMDVCAVLGGIRGCLGCILCQKRLRLSCKSGTV